MRKSKKYTPDVLLVGAASFVGSALTQQALLMPKTDLKIAEGFTVPVQGILPLSQKYVAEIARKALNEALPASMGFASSTLDKLNVREEFKKGVLWFLYDFMNKYSLNTILTALFGRLKFVDREKYKDLFREYIQKLIEEKADRDAIIQSVTTEVVNILRIITEGTMASIIFNERFAEAASGTIAAAIDRFLDNDAASRVTEYLFGVVSQLEEVTLANFMTNMLGLGRAEMANFIDNAYDAILGPSMIDAVRDMRVGDIVYDLYVNIDYDEVYAYLKSSMNNDLMRLNFTGAMTAMSFYSKAKKKARKHYKRRERKNKSSGEDAE